MLLVDLEKLKQSVLDLSLDVGVLTGDLLVEVVCKVLDLQHRRAHGLHDLIIGWKWSGSDKF